MDFFRKQSTNNQRMYSPPVHLTRLYIFALSVVALLSIASQFQIQSALREQMDDSFIINMAGRQRMLSQKIAKQSLNVESQAKINQVSQDDVNDLKESLEQWHLFHNGLYYRENSQINLKGENSDEVNRMFGEIDPFHQNILQDAHTLINLLPHQDSIPAITREVNEILYNESFFLSGMELIVRQYGEEARGRVALVRRIEWALLVIVLMVLVLEGLFIFRPVTNKIKNTLLSLQEARSKLRKSNQELEEKIDLRTKEISEKREQLEKQNQQLGEINKDLDNFVYSASHDLKAPINNIEGLLNALETSFPDVQEKAGQFLGMMHDSIDRFKLVLTDLSDTGKAKQEILGEKEVLDIEEICHEVVLNMSDMVEKFGAKIVTDFSHAPEVKFSKKNFRSIMHNLISNAIKYSSPKRKPIIKVSSRRSGEFLLLRISDNGLGIKEEDFPKIFTIYERIHDHVEGSGVGMSLVKKIVENSGGKIEVRSVVDKGTTFCIYLRNQR